MTVEVKKGPKMSHTAERLTEAVRRLKDGCKLDAPDGLADEVRGLPMDVALAVSTACPELVNVAKALGRQPTKAEWDAVIDLVRVLMQTNALLQEHANQVAELVTNWTGHFKGVLKAAMEIEGFANFRQVYEPDEDDD